tara:strand:+ start:603 stop:890 length:288 start_codon:yes stop_codon:yes gene_type:complete
MAQENGPWQRQGPCVFAEASNCRVPPEGLEPGDVTPFQPEHLRQTLNQRAAECAAVGDDLPPIDPELVQVIEAWSTLPPAIRTAILAIVEAAQGR